MDSEHRGESRIDTNSAIEKRSSAADRLVALLLRPVAARLAEPVLCSIAFASFFASAGATGAEAAGFAHDPRSVASVAIAFLAARLVVDTAPNLVVCGRLEAAPYAEHYILRSLARVKLVLGTFVTLLALVVATIFDHALAAAQSSAALLAAALLSYSITAPVVLSHRGVPTARPSIAPFLSAALLVLLCPFVREDGGSFLKAFAGSILVGNALGGGIQRYRAAARRLARPGSIHVQSKYDPIAHSMESEHATILAHAVGSAPFLLLPLVPAWIDFRLDAATPPLAVLAAFLAAALPPILFDAKRPVRRFRFTSYSAAFALFVASWWVADRAASRPLLDTAFLLAAYPSLNALLARGARRALISCLVVYALSRIVLAIHAPATPWPIAEALLVVLSTAAVLESGVAERRVS